MGAKPRLYSPAAIGRRLGRPAARVRDALRRLGVEPAVRLGRRVFFPESSVGLAAAELARVGAGRRRPRER